MSRHSYIGPPVDHTHNLTMKSTNETLKALGNGPCFRCGTSTSPPFRTFTALEPPTMDREWCANCFNNDLPGSPFLSQHYGQKPVNSYIPAPGVHNAMLQIHTPGAQLNQAFQPLAPLKGPVVLTPPPQSKHSVLGQKKKKRAAPPVRKQEKPHTGRSLKGSTAPCCVCGSTASWEWHTHLYAEDKDPHGRKWCAKCYRADHHRKTKDRIRARKPAKEQGGGAGGGNEAEEKNGDQQRA